MAATARLKEPLLEERGQPAPQGGREVRIAALLTPATDGLAKAMLGSGGCTIAVKSTLAKFNYNVLPNLDLNRHERPFWRSNRLTVYVFKYKMYFA
jgi:hypothetical protein